MTSFNASILAQPGPISDLTEQILSFLKEQQVEPRPAHHVALIVEELLTNLGTHAACQHKPAQISLAVEATRVTGSIVDRAPPFDPLKAPEPDLTAGPEERSGGGLGLFLVRRFASSLEYERRNNENCTTFSVLRSSTRGR
jgi:anti-sigma regulatory factor (Ser/Thr protein kinase)